MCFLSMSLQTQLSLTLNQTIQQRFRLFPQILVLSGHDHDQCTITHKSEAGSVTEVTLLSNDHKIIGSHYGQSLIVNILLQHTLGTISWQQGNIYPSFMLLSVPNAVHQNSSDLEKMLHTQLCFLPCQLFIYMWYVHDQIVLGFMIIVLMHVYEFLSLILNYQVPFSIRYVPSCSPSLAKPWNKLLKQRCRLYLKCNEVKLFKQRHEGEERR